MTKCDIHLVVDKNPSIEKPATAEVVVSVKGTIIRASKNTHDMYASIDAVGDSVRRKLRKYKEVKSELHFLVLLLPRADVLSCRESSTLTARENLRLKAST